jgi:hypothetical protein
MAKYGIGAGGESFTRISLRFMRATPASAPIPAQIVAALRRFLATH